MSIRQTFTLTIKDDAGRVVATDESAQLGDDLAQFSETSPASGNVTVPVVVPVADIIGFWVISDQDVTMLENVADLSHALVANVPFWWHLGQGACPFTIDIATLKFTNAGLVDANVKGAILSA